MGRTAPDAETWPSATRSWAAYQVGVLAFGVLGLLWSGLSIQSASLSDELFRVQNTVLSGEKYPDQALRELATAIEDGGFSACDTNPQTVLAIVKLRLAERALAKGDLPLFDRQLAELSDASRDLLACSPHQALVWLIRFWLHVLSGSLDAQSWRLLEASYRLGPNEGWLAIHRNPLGLRLLAAAPETVRPLVLDEFKGLVRSGYNWEAAQAYAAATPATQAMLSSALEDLDPGTRRAFSAALEAAGADPLPDRDPTPSNSSRIVVP